MTNPYDRNNRNPNNRRRPDPIGDAARREGTRGRQTPTSSGLPRKAPSVKSATQSRQRVTSTNGNHRQRVQESSKHASPSKKSNTRSSTYPGHATLWTKDKGKGSAQSGSAFGFLGGVFGTLCRGLKAGIFGLGRFFAFVFSQIARSKIAIFATVIIVAFVVTGLVDMSLNWGKVYSGVKIGEVDLSGKTAEEAAILLDNAYAGRLADKEVLVFANEEASNNIEQTIANAHDNSLTEQQSVEEALANKTLWTATASSLSAQLDTEALTEEALAVGRDNGGIFERFSAFVFGFEINPRATYDEEALEHLAREIDTSIGVPRVNFGIRMYDDKAWVTDGRDGDMVNRDDFRGLLNSSFFSDEGKQATFVATTEYTPIQITREEAERTASFVNETIAHGATFTYGGTEWAATATDLGSWIKTRVIEGNKGYELEPYLDQAIAKGIVLNHLKTNFDGDTMKVTFEVTDDGKQIVHTDTEETIPLAGDAIFILNQKLFQADGTEDLGSGPLMIEVGSKQVPDTMTLDEALENGVISSIAAFTTEYTVEPVERQHNIHLVSDMLSNSIIKANGGTWSFNDIAGNCNEESGFQSAGAIVGGEFVDSVGGGICQVATTVFNSVYDTGYPVLTRHNHSLYIGSYPAGRDAAVNWPDLDLVWENDSSSDALLVMSYTDTTVTATIYGVNPEYQVSTQVGEWQEGEKFQSKSTTDENLAPGSSYVKTVGADGRNITIVRSVKDKNGTLLREDVFSSTYDPKDEVKVQGPAIEDKTTSNDNDTKESQTSEGNVGS